MGNFSGAEGEISTEKEKYRIEIRSYCMDDLDPAAKSGARFLAITVNHGIH